MASGNSHGNSQLSRLKNTLLQVAERLESLEHHDHEGEIIEPMMATVQLYVEPTVRC